MRFASYSDTREECTNLCMESATHLFRAAKKEEKSYLRHLVHAVDWSI